MSVPPVTVTNMAGNSPRKQTWSDAKLTAAVTVSRSWRGVMRELGLCVTSAGSIRVVKGRVALLGLDTSHFTNQRTWSDEALKRGVAQAHSWNELLTAIGLKSNSPGERTRVTAHALRLGLDLSRLTEQSQERRDLLTPKPALKNLREAATSLAAAWFALCGFTAAIPVEPALYDLLVSLPEGIKRIQVKTTTHNSKSGWIVQVGRRPYSIKNNSRLVPYDPEFIDLFFIVDGDLALYLIPSKVIAGRVGLVLRTYTKYIVGNAAGLMPLHPKVA
jgi:PD-(D/E)XK endonuclease